MDEKEMETIIEDEQLSDFEKLSPIKKNIVRILSAALFGLALWAVVYCTDTVMDLLRSFFISSVIL